MAERAIVVGSGPNGLSAAVTLARAGLEVDVYERSPYLGGGVSTRELTIPGAWHDVCSAVHPMAVTSDFFRRFRLSDRIELLTPEISYGQPLESGRAAIAYRDLERTASELGVDSDVWRRLFAPLSADALRMSDLIGRPMIRIPDHPVALTRFGLRVLLNGTPAWNLPFRGTAAPALLTGVFAHTMQHLPGIGTAAAGLALASFAHSVGWPIPRGGSQQIADAMIEDIKGHGGRLHPDAEITSLADLPPARIVLLDITPKALVRLAGDRLPDGFVRSMRRFRYGSGVAKADFVLSEPVPWANESLRSAVTVHVGGTRRDVARAENTVAKGMHAQQPYVLSVQPTVLDPSRAPEGQHILWAYTHVPEYSPLDQTDAIVNRIERFAPGFRDTIVATSSRSALEVDAQNPNNVGGDISAGKPSAWQLIARPRLSTTPWDTPIPGTYLCSASTAPGPGVHGQPGWLAARRALARELGIRVPPDLSPTTRGSTR